MQYCAVFLLLISFEIIGSKLMLKKGVNETIKFSGNDLIVLVENPNYVVGSLSLCLKSLPNINSKRCPNGYIYSFITTTDYATSFAYIINRQGDTNSSSKLSGTLFFNKDKSIDVFLAEMSDGLTITLKNAVSVKNDEKSKAGLSKTTIGCIIGVIVLFLIVVLVVLGLLYKFCKKPTHEPVPTTVPEADQRSTIQAPVAAAVDAAIVPAPKVDPPKMSSATTAKKTSTSTTKQSNTKTPSEETPLLLLPTVQQKVNTAPVITPAPTLKSTSVNATNSIAPLQPSKESDTKMSKEMPVSALPMTPLAHSTSSLLQVEKTQSPTEASAKTSATADFKTDATTNELATNSAIKSRVYLSRNEAPVFGSTKRRRSKPVIDEVDEFKLVTETSLCFGQREGTLTSHNYTKPSISESVVRKMPLCGLYTLLLDTKFPHDFRVQLAAEIRTRASSVIARFQQEALRDTAFPMPYLTLVYHKNNRSFVEGLEIHSKVSKKSSKKKSKKKHAG